jgi:hypothetical protein
LGKVLKRLYNSHSLNILALPYSHNQALTDVRWQLRLFLHLKGLFSLGKRSALQSQKGLFPFKESLVGCFIPRVPRDEAFLFSCSTRVHSQCHAKLASQRRGRNPHNPQFE